MTPRFDAYRHPRGLPITGQPITQLITHCPASHGAPVPIHPGTIVTVSVWLFEFTEPELALMVVVPTLAETPVKNPYVATVAADVLLLVHVADPVQVTTEKSEYVHCAEQ